MLTCFLATSSYTGSPDMLAIQTSSYNHHYTPQEGANASDKDWLPN